MSNQDPQTAVEQARKTPAFSNPAMLEMSEAEFQIWRHNPTTRSFLLFLAHRAQSLSKAALDFYLSGNLEEVEKRDPLRGRIVELEGLCIVKLSDIQQFYGKEPEASETRQSK